MNYESDGSRNSMSGALVSQCPDLCFSKVRDIVFQSPTLSIYNIHLLFSCSFSLSLKLCYLNCTIAVTQQPTKVTVNSLSLSLLCNMYCNNCNATSIFCRRRHHRASANHNIYHSSVNKVFHFLPTTTNSSFFVIQPKVERVNVKQCKIKCIAIIL